MTPSKTKGPAQDNHSILRAGNLAIGYRRSEPIVRGINLDFSTELTRTRVLGFVGPNGAGKTTLLKTCLGLLSPLDGELSLLGSDTRNHDFAGVRKKLAYIPQNRPEGSAGQLRISVWEAVSFGRLGRNGVTGRFRGVDRDAIDAAIAYCGLEKLASRAVQDLSGGQFQRVSIARAMAAEPSLYLLDEPGSFLDHEGQGAIRELIVSLATSGVPLILVTHDRALMELCGAVLFFEKGNAKLLDTKEYTARAEGLAT